VQIRNRENLSNRAARANSGPLRHNNAPAAVEATGVIVGFG
jgi:hypothetical protein